MIDSERGDILEVKTAQDMSDSIMGEAKNLFLNAGTAFVKLKEYEGFIHKAIDQIDEELCRLDNKRITKKMGKRLYECFLAKRNWETLLDVLQKGFLPTSLKIFDLCEKSWGVQGLEKLKSDTFPSFPE